MALFPTLKDVRSSLANPDDFLNRWFHGGTKTVSGVNVTERNELNFVTVFACVRILSKSIACLPLHLYRRKEDGGKERAYGHPLYKILHDQPNPEMTSFIFRETLSAHLVSWGNCYAHKEMNKAGRVKYLWPLRPDHMTVERKNGVLVYRYQTQKGEKILSKDEVFHIAGLGFDGIKGYSPIRMAANAIGLAMATEEFGARFFGQGAHPGGIIEYPGKLSDKALEQFRSSASKNYEGLGKSHKIMFLEQGLKYVQTGIPPEDAQFLETRRFQKEEIASLFDIKPHMLADLERATFSNIEQLSLEFVTYTLMPWLIRWEQNIKKDLIYKTEKDIYFAEHSVDGLLRADIKSRNEALEIQRRNGIINANDWARKENMNPIPGDQGEKYFVPLNWIEMGSSITEEKPSKEEKSKAYGNIELRQNKSILTRKRLRRRYYDLFRDAAGRITRREVNDIKAMTGKYLKQRNVVLLKEKIEDFYDNLGGYIEKNISPVVASYADAIQDAVSEEINVEPEKTPEFERYVKGYVDIYTEQHIQSSKGQLNKLIKETNPEELREVIEKRLDEWEEKNPDKIADRETVNGDGAFAKYVIFAAGYKLVWRTSGEKSCPYCEALDGKVVGRGEYFVNKGEQFEPEGADGSMKIYGPKKHPQLHQGCSCFVVAG